MFWRSLYISWGLFGDMIEFAIYVFMNLVLELDSLNPSCRAPRTTKSIHVLDVNLTCIPVASTLERRRNKFYYLSFICLNLILSMLYTMDTLKVFPQSIILVPEVRSSRVSHINLFYSLHYNYLDLVFNIWLPRRCMYKKFRE